MLIVPSRCQETLIAGSLLPVQVREFLPDGKTMVLSLSIEGKPEANATRNFAQKFYIF